MQGLHEKKNHSQNIHSSIQGQRLQQQQERLQGSFRMHRPQRSFLFSSRKTDWLSSSAQQIHVVCMQCPDKTEN